MRAKRTSQASFQVGESSLASESVQSGSQLGGITHTDHFCGREEEGDLDEAGVSVPQITVLES